MWPLLSALLFNVLLFPQGTFAVEVDAHQAQFDLTPYLQVYDTPYSSQEGDFQKFPYKVAADQELKRGYSEDELWVKIELTNPTSEVIKRVLYLSAPLSGFVSLRSDENPKSVMVSGSSIPWLQRSLKSRLTGFQLELPPGATKTYFLRRYSHHSLLTKIFLTDPELFRNIDSDNKAFLFFYLGGILCLVLYNLSIGVFARDFNFLRYAFFATAFAASAITLNGVMDAYLFPHLNFSFSHYQMCFSAMATLSGHVFVYHFLEIPKTIPKAKKIFYILSAVAVINFIVGFFSGQYSQQAIFGNLTDLNIFLTCLFLIGCGFVAYHRGYVLAKFLVLSWACVLMGVLTWFAMTARILPNGFLTQNSLILGNLGEMLILSFGLAYKINILDQEVKNAQAQIKEKKRYHLLVKVLSHDIANALTIINGYLGRLVNAKFEPSEAKALEKIRDVVVKMRETLGFVREEEKLKSFQETAKLELVDLREVAQDVVHFYEEHLQSKNMKVQILIPAQTLVMAEKSVLSNQVVSNLFSNAIKFSRMGGEIILSTEEQPSTVRFVIRDYGVGIKPELVQRVFFSDELVTTFGTSSEQGTGIGTSLVREYMQMFKGEVIVDSIHESISKNSGTTVTLKFPRPTR